MTRKLISIVLALCLTLSCFAIGGMSASAATASDNVGSIQGGQTIYFAPADNWKQDNARFALYYFNNDNNTYGWKDFAPVANTNGIYSATMSSETWDGIIFVRMNPNTSENNWNNKWNQTADIFEIPSGKNLFNGTSGAWDGDNGSWGVYNPNAPTGNITVYFTDAMNWGSANVYYWGTNSDPTWPGTAMTVYQESNDYGQKVYKATIPAAATGIIFNGDGKQTVDINDGIANGALWYTNGEMDGSNYKVTKADTTIVEETTAPPANSIAVLFTDAVGWGEANVYYWGSNSDPEWPGNAMTVDSTNPYGQKVYKAYIPSGVTGVIFNGNGKQTVDITTGIENNAQWYTIDEKEGSNYKVVKVGTPVNPTTAAPTTVAPTTVVPTTVEPTTVEPTTVEPTTVEPTTVEPTTVEPTTVEPTTVEPTTVEPTTVEPTTVEPTTVEPTTVEPTTVEPTTVEPTTVEPTTVEPTTVPEEETDKIFVGIEVKDGSMIVPNTTYVNVHWATADNSEQGDLPVKYTGITDTRRAAAWSAQPRSFALFVVEVPERADKVCLRNGPKVYSENAANPYFTIGDYDSFYLYNGSTGDNISVKTKFLKVSFDYDAQVVPTTTIRVGVQQVENASEFFAMDSLRITWQRVAQGNGYTVLCRGEEVLNPLNRTESRSLGERYWNGAEKTYTLYNVQVPADSSFFNPTANGKNYFTQDYSYGNIVDHNAVYIFDGADAGAGSHNDNTVYLHLDNVEEPTTVEPTTVEPTTVAPTTVEPTTVAPTTVAPTTAEPTTEPVIPTEGVTIKVVVPNIVNSAYAWNNARLYYNNTGKSADNQYINMVENNVYYMTELGNGITDIASVGGWKVFTVTLTAEQAEAVNNALWVGFANNNNRCKTVSEKAKNILKAGVGTLDTGYSNTKASIASFDGYTFVIKDNNSTTSPYTSFIGYWTSDFTTVTAAAPMSDNSYSNWNAMSLSYGATGDSEVAIPMVNTGTTTKVSNIGDMSTLRAGRWYIYAVTLDASQTAAVDSANRVSFVKPGGNNRTAGSKNVLKAKTNEFDGNYNKTARTLEELEGQLFVVKAKASATSIVIYNGEWETEDVYTAGNNDTVEIFFAAPKGVANTTAGWDTGVELYYGNTTAYQNCSRIEMTPVRSTRTVSVDGTGLTTLSSGEWNMYSITMDAEMISTIDAATTVGFIKKGSYNRTSALYTKNIAKAPTTEDGTYSKNKQSIEAFDGKTFVINTCADAKNERTSYMGVWCN